MRVTGGTICGRLISAPPGAVRPTQDRVREALFSSLGDRVAGAEFLDLYAGSGAVGLEAWSRGAGGVCWVEGDRRVFGVLRRNVLSLCGPTAAGGGPNRVEDDMPRVRMHRADSIAFLKKGLAFGRFDLVFADPPYGRKGEEGAAGSILAAAARVLAPGGTVVVEQSKGSVTVEPHGWRLVKDRAYGAARLVFYAASRETSPAGAGERRKETQQ